MNTCVWIEEYSVFLVVGIKFKAKVSNNDQHRIVVRRPRITSPTKRVDEDEMCGTSVGCIEGGKKVNYRGFFRPPRRNENLTLESDAIVGTRVVGEFTQEEDGDITDDALFVRVILAWACLPVAIIINVVLPRWVLVA